MQAKLHDLKEKVLDILCDGAIACIRAWRVFRKYLPQLGGVLLAVFALGSVYAFYGLYQPPAFFPTATIVTVPEGVSIREAGEILEREQVVSSALAFRALLKFSREDDVSIRAGDYYFSEPLTLAAVAQRVTNGVFGMEPVRVTIPEGATIAQMVDIFDAVFERFDPATFHVLADSKEGYLFPDTYLFMPNVTTAEIVEELERTFYERLHSVEEQIAQFGRPIHEIITMASLLEKEAYDHDERKQIAGVLWNRLSIDMPLQVDAVFSFIFNTEMFSPQYSDLEVDSPYNVYEHIGLPPGPIGSPSLSAIEAAVTPEETDALFYLHGRDGLLRLARTYDEHLVNRYRYLD